MRLLVSSIIVALLLGVTACGQKGPLYLPQDPPQKNEQPTQSAS